MKILYATDIHENYENLEMLEEFRKDSKPDLEVLAGDYINVGFESEYDFQKYMYFRSAIAHFLQLNFKPEDFPSPEQYVRAVPYIAEHMVKDKDGELVPYNTAQQNSPGFLAFLDLHREGGAIAGLC